MGDARGWRSDEFVASIMEDRRRRDRIVFSARFAPEAVATPQLIVAATNDGAVALHSLERPVNETSIKRLAAHQGPAYDLLSFGRHGDEMLSSCGDDGRILVWRWTDVLAAADYGENGSECLQPLVEFTNPQHRGPYGALSPMPEVNSLAVDVEAGHIFSASGDGCAYAWDLETGQSALVFRGHSDYLHCVVSRPSQKQIITGSEDGTARIWDCRSGRCTAILDPWNAVTVKRQPKDHLPWVSCMAMDASESWMICGSGAKSLTLWNLPMVSAATRIATQAPAQAVTFTKDQIVVAGGQPHVSRFSVGGELLAQVACAPKSSFCVDVNPSGVTVVAGYRGLVDVITEFGSHLATISC